MCSVIVIRSVTLFWSTSLPRYRDPSRNGDRESAWNYEITRWTGSPNGRPANIKPGSERRVRAYESLRNRQGRDTYLGMVRANEEQSLGFGFEFHGELFGPNAGCVR